MDLMETTSKQPEYSTYAQALRNAEMTRDKMDRLAKEYPTGSKDRAWYFKQKRYWASSVRWWKKIIQDRGNRDLLTDARVPDGF